MGHTFEQETLSSGKQVTLVSWEDESPTQHGSKLQNKPWKDSDTRSKVGFYDSTVEFMRNDWAEKFMSPQGFETPQGNVMLYHNRDSNTWHSTDALDIDHIKPWKEHFTALGVKTHADAHMAYNDVGNLRMLPAVVNRARDSADNVFKTYGADSPQWKEWVSERFGFDAKANHPAFDDERDLARRTKTTMGQGYEPEDGRKGLSFDAGVVGKWYEAQLQSQYACTVEATHPKTGDKQQVHLFRCAASGQLCTRDALDIDHELPFEILAKAMMKHTSDGTATKANALDAYNETSNLRLVGRSVNSSHEFELNEQMEFRDKEKPERRNEFKNWLVDDGQQLSDSMRKEIRDLARTYEPGRPILLKDADHPDNKLYNLAMNGLSKTDIGQKMNPQERENASGALVVAAKAAHLSTIDVVARSTDGNNLFAVQGDLKGLHHYGQVATSVAVNHSIQQSTQDLAKINATQQNPQQQTQKHSMFQ
ncbi:XVIPCD domain-containing protein [Lysobacter sp. CCNWLW3]|uniref:XVIPCD domain-containing protein n=1 Tax=unclassified Lysobacter TaxID=2635362 RepID=UPI002FD59E70